MNWCDGNKRGNEHRVIRGIDLISCVDVNSTTEQFWVIDYRLKKQKHCLPGELEVGDCWIGLSQAKGSGLILSARMGKRTDKLSEGLVTSTEGKTDCQFWDTDGWGARKRVLPPEAQHHIGKDRTQQLGGLTVFYVSSPGRWHR